MGLLTRLFGRAETATEATPPPSEQPTTAPPSTTSPPPIPRRNRRTHPQAPRLLGLIGRRQVHADELAQIEAERETDARPFAERIEMLEGEDGEVERIANELVAVGREIDEAIADAEEQLRLLRDVREAVNDGLREKADRRETIRAELSAARAQFDKVAEPPHVKHVKRRIGHLDEQIERILDRHPELRLTELDKLVEQEFAREGLPERIQKVSDTFRSDAFRDAFRAAVDEAKGTPRDPKNEEQIRAFAYEVLHGLGVNTRDVHFHVFWSGPKGNKAKGLGPNQLAFSTPSVSSFAVERCKAALVARRAEARAGEANAA